jgi:hypothetical protein
MIQPWRKLIATNDHEAIRRALCRIVSARTDTPDDVAHDLYVRLFEKRRFEFYLTSGMTDEEIGRQLVGLELRNMRNDSLRRQLPERYRLAVRVSRVLRQSARVKRMPGARYTASERPDTVPDLVDIVIRPRDVRRAGRGITDQIVITNQDLEQLIVDILGAFDRPVSKSTLRGEVFARLTIFDPEFLEFEHQRDGDSAPFELPLADASPDPELQLLATEEIKRARTAARSLWRGLDERARHILIGRYLGIRRMSQVEVAGRLGVSNSLISSREQVLLKTIRTTWSGCPATFVDALRQEATRT